MPSVKAKVEAFTLIELLAVIFIFALLAALLLPALADRNHKSSPIARCMNNQKQIAIGLMAWKTDHGEQFPWKVSSTNGGTFEAAARGYAAPSFQCLSNYIGITSVSVFVCPTDTSRIQATNFVQFRNLNVSYFFSLDTSTNAAKSILTGDRHLKRFNNPVKPGLFVYSNALTMDWSRELHPIGSPSYLSEGILSFADGHVERVMGADLNSVFQREGLATNHLAVP
jgi:prepilin-type N-terminal cleavage/methylation domain-containing protein